MRVLPSSELEARPTGRAVTFPLFVGFTVAASGGPLALASLYLPGTMSSFQSIGLMTVLAAAVFLAPLGVWLRYSQRVVSAGGLYSFVEVAAGRRIALVQGGVWIVSYALYLPYTIVYIVYDLLPVAVPGVAPYRPLLDLVLPAAIALLGFVAVGHAMRVMAALAVAQIALLAVYSAAALGHAGLHPGSFTAHGSALSLSKGTGNASLLFVCSNLSLYLGGETHGGSRTVRRGLLLGFAIAAAAVIAGSLAFAGATRAELNTNIPGVAVAQDAVGHWFAVILALGVAASVAGVVIAEYFALSRVARAMSGRPQTQVTLVVAAFFMASSAIALVDPDAFYASLIKPSLIALWLSQLLVFAVYPRFAALQRASKATAVGLTLVASALVGYGLYAALNLVTST